jgi:hypothetical protein
MRYISDVEWFEVPEGMTVVRIPPKFNNLGERISNVGDDYEKLRPVALSKPNGEVVQLAFSEKVNEKLGFSFEDFFKSVQDELYQVKVGYGRNLNKLNDEITGLDSKIAFYENMTFIQRLKFLFRGKK